MIKKFFICLLFLFSNPLLYCNINLLNYTGYELGRNTCNIIQLGTVNSYSRLGIGTMLYKWYSSDIITNDAKKINADIDDIGIFLPIELYFPIHTWKSADKMLFSNKNLTGGDREAVGLLYLFSSFGLWGKTNRSDQLNSEYKYSFYDVGVGLDFGHLLGVKLGYQYIKINTHPAIVEKKLALGLNVYLGGWYSTESNEKYNYGFIPWISEPIKIKRQEEEKREKEALKIVDLEVKYKDEDKILKPGQEFKLLVTIENTWDKPLTNISLNIYKLSNMLNIIDEYNVVNVVEKLNPSERFVKELKFKAKDDLPTQEFLVEVEVFDSNGRKDIKTVSIKAISKSELEYKKYYGLAEEEFKKGSLDKAINLMKKAISNVKKQEAIDKLKEFEKYKEREDNYQKHYNLGLKYFRTGGIDNYENALDEFKKAKSYKDSDEVNRMIRKVQEEYKKNLKRI